MTRQQEIAWRVAFRAEANEVQMQRALGVSWPEAYQHALPIGTEVYALAMAPARDIQLEPMRFISGRPL